MMIGSSGFAVCPIQIADLEAHRQLDSSNTRTHMHAKGRLAEILHSTMQRPVYTEYLRCALTIKRGRDRICDVGV
jgi:hypothetical protein